MQARLQQRYKEELAPRLLKEFGYASPMQVPRLDKITINMGVGDAARDRSALDNAMEELTAVTGQKPMVTRARKSVAGFKIRAGMPVGCKVTLRRERMYEFLERFIQVALPRIRDFRGLNGNSFDGQGNYAMGVTEQIIFPEVDYEKIDRVRGMDIIFSTTAPTDEEAKALLDGFGMPFRN
ncbi:50S ribosomal protein L5 [Thiohalorhabdus denitrificans]|uniref:Large ribosomal subunit protein uL5 n=1 Tax=Thiohalorhabdus denitrificans TaxID=381306 RepID=A0A0P9CPE0_9GAMM|nr:50S ribosomal protein L5 [Thiohalorhabdus denitrificans]KPV40966.1 50S ribosomal protein L5 [Thiohalorhabdus denitrificans]SCY43155.1 LSU ribosomal protein L5P [Thiohalorhabdus denitrificans]